MSGSIDNKPQGKGELRITCLGKYGPYPAAGGASSGYLLQANGHNILLDCGSGVMSRLQQHCAFYELDAIVLSHLHIDHCCDMPILAQALDIHGGNMPTVYLPATPKAEYENIRRRGFPLHTVEAGDKLEIAGLEIVFHETKHPVECNAMRIEYGGRVLFFTGDTNWLDSLADAAANADILLCDAAFTDENWNDKKPHMSARLASELAAKAGVAKLILTHMVPGYERAAVMAQACEAFANTEIIEEGQEYSV